MAFIGNTVQTQGFTPAIDYFNGNGVTVTFTLSRPIASVAQVIVAVDNVIQNPSSAFGVVGNSITFTSAPLSGTNNIWVEYTSLITTYQGISQDPTVIGDIRATGGYLAEGDFGNSFVDGNLIDYVTGAGRLTVGELDDLVFYHGGTSARSEMMRVSYAGNSTLEGKLTATGNGSFQGVYIGRGTGAISTNTAVGLTALAGSNSGTGENVGVGYEALKVNTTGNRNTAVGLYSAGANTTGNNNVAIGNSSLQTNTTGGNNVAVGNQALQANTTASNNTAVGYEAGYNNTVGQFNVLLGYRAGYRSAGTGTIGDASVFVGYQAGYANQGNNNIGIGNGALSGNTSGTFNLGVGVSAGSVNTNGGNLISIGYDSGKVFNGGSGGLYIGTDTRASAAGAINEFVIGVNHGGSMIGKGNNSGYIVPGGGGVYQVSNSSSWATTSDRRLKKNIVDSTEGLDVISRLQVRNFEYRKPEEITDLPPEQAIQKEGVQLGVIAQELQEVCPDCVKEESTGVLSVDSDNIFWHLVNAVKQQQAIITDLKARIEALENK
jgi:trimeric autotransporter adhesin